MITAVNRALAGKRDAITKNDKGFTLIELLVVVLIIGILAAIAIPVFLGQQNSAKDSAAKSDLANAKIAVIAYATDNAGAYPADTGAAAALKNYGYTKTDNTGAFSIVSSDATAGTFCLEEISQTTTPFYVTDSTSVSTTACS